MCYFLTNLNSRNRLIAFSTSSCFADERSGKFLGQVPGKIIAFTINIHGKPVAKFLAPKSRRDICGKTKTITQLSICIRNPSLILCFLKTSAGSHFLFKKNQNVWRVHTYSSWYAFRTCILLFWWATWQTRGTFVERKPRTNKKIILRLGNFLPCELNYLLVKIYSRLSGWSCVLTGFSPTGYVSYGW